MGFHGGSDGFKKKTKKNKKKTAFNAGDLGLIPGSERSPGKKEWQSTPVFLPGEFHRQRSLPGYLVHEVTKSCK